jgi:hypothetical protein
MLLTEAPEVLALAVLASSLLLVVYGTLTGHIAATGLWRAGVLQVGPIGKSGNNPAQVVTTQAPPIDRIGRYRVRLRAGSSAGRYAQTSLCSAYDFFES